MDSERGAGRFRRLELQGQSQSDKGERVESSSLAPWAALDDSGSFPLVMTRLAALTRQFEAGQSMRVPAPRGVPASTRIVIASDAAVATQCASASPTARRSLSACAREWQERRLRNGPALRDTPTEYLADELIE